VQHYGYCFDYSQRGVDAQQRIGSLPHWVQPLAQQMEVGVPVLAELEILCEVCCGWEFTMYNCRLAVANCVMYGYCFDYSQRGVGAQQRIGPLPDGLQPLVQQLEVRV
jgi:hypothetical protein